MVKADSKNNSMMKILIYTGCISENPISWNFILVGKGILLNVLSEMYVIFEML